MFLRNVLLFWPKIYSFPSVIPYILEAPPRSVLTTESDLPVFIYCRSWDVLLFRKCSFAKLTLSSICDIISFHFQLPFLSLCRLASGSYLLCRKIYRLPLLRWPCSEYYAWAVVYLRNKLENINFSREKKKRLQSNLISVLFSSQASPVKFGLREGRGGEVGCLMRERLEDWVDWLSIK